jgi:hypothetical protein
MTQHCRPAAVALEEADASEDENLGDLLIKMQRERGLGDYADDDDRAYKEKKVRNVAAGDA